jgi:hypothetical protein
VSQENRVVQSVLRLVFMAALKWARNEVTDDGFVKTVLSAAERLKQERLEGDHG